LLRKKYEGINDRLAFYVSVRPGAEDDRWRRLVSACR
jgi:hypothetical protein